MAKGGANGGAGGRLQGLVLTGGGARAAYQVGALRAIAEITNSKRIPFHIVSGYSAGAINGAWLLSRAPDFRRVTREMWEQWSAITADRVFKTDPFSMMKISLRWVKDRGSGGLPNRQISYLLDTAPLRDFLRDNIDFQALNANLRRGPHAFSVTAVNYHTGQSTAFFEGRPTIREWRKLNRLAVRTPLGLPHIMASAAIPIFFPPVRIGDAHYGDGMIRLNAPLSTPIHMGADRLTVIGIRGPSSTSAPDERKRGTVCISEIAGTILNGLFFDALDADIARTERINRTVSLLPARERRKNPDRLRPVPVLVLQPSQEVADLPGCQLSRLPMTMRFFLRGLGLEQDKGQDLLSYLSFEPQYIRALLELGHADTMDRRDEILEHIEGTRRP